MNNTKIWATFEDSFDIKCRVIKWDEKDGINFIPRKKYVKRDVTLQQLKGLINQFTIHWSVTYRAKHMETGLIARGLSCNFMIDDNCNKDGYADIYQCLPIMYGGYSQGSAFNSLGPGVEISYMPQYWERQDLYSSYNCKKYDVEPHKTATVPIHGTKLKVHLPSDAQIKALKALLWGFSELFPTIPPQFPKTSDNKYITTVLKDPIHCLGFLNHYHLKRGKIDTAGLDMKDIEESVQKMRKWGY